MPKGRLLYVTVDDFPPQRVDLSELFGKEMNELGYEVDWLAQAHEHCPTFKQTAWRGGTAFVGPKTQGRSIKAKLKNAWQSIQTDWKVLALAKRRYDVIQVRDKFIVAILALIAAKIYRAKFTYWLSYPFPEAHLYRASKGYSRFPTLDLVRGHLFGFLLYKIIMPRADHNFVQSEQMKSDIAAKGIDPSRMTPVPMGVSMKEVVEKPEFTRGQLVYIGAMATPRRIDFLVDVLAHLKKMGVECHLKLVGTSENPKDIENLKTQASELGVSDRVSFLGQLPIEETWKIVSESHVGLSPIAPNPMYRPASPTKLVEYMALKTAVVANDHREQQQVINDSAAGLCTAFEVVPFAEAVATLLADPKLCREMGERGYEWVLKHRDYRQIAVSLDPLYEVLCQREPASPQSSTKKATSSH